MAVVPRHNFELCHGAAGRNAVIILRQNPEFTEKFSDTLWCIDVAYLVDVP
jgi:hypothetical protein